MKTRFFYFASVTVLFLLFFSCQKEISFENGQPSEGWLDKDLHNNCLPPTIKGSYSSGKKLDENNYIEVKVHVTAAGAYSISTDTVNGYFFKTTGNFKDTGFITVKLPGSGRPDNPGSNQFRMVYGTSDCEITITVLNGSSIASFTLQGAPGACMSDTIIGNYIKGLPLDTGNYVKIAVNVTVPGTYSISTNAVNGYGYSAAGTFTAKGPQTVYLASSGAPLNSGTDIFTVTAGASSCVFSVTVLTVVTTTNNDLFPLTMNSYWVYDDLYYQGSTVRTAIIDTAAFNGKSYKIMEKQISPGGPLLFYYRKSGSDYFEYAQIDKYTASVTYNKRIYDDLPFLKENLGAGDAWQSNEYSDTATFGQVINIQYDYVCLGADISTVINGKAFAHVYEIEMKPQIRAVDHGFNNTGEIYTYYYAKGIGLISYKETSLGSNYGRLEINNWQVY